MFIRKKMKEGIMFEKDYRSNTF